MENRLMYHIVIEHLEDIKRFVKNKKANLEPLKIQLLISKQMVQPTDDTKVSWHANAKTKTLTTETQWTENNSIDVADGWINQTLLFINEFSSFHGPQFSFKEHHRQKFCERCLEGIQDTIAVEKYLKSCQELKIVHITMPTKESQF